MSHRQNQNRINKHTRHNRRNACQCVDDKTHRVTKTPATDFGKINPDGDTQRQTNRRRKNQQHERTENRVSNAAAFTHRLWTGDEKLKAE